MSPRRDTISNRSMVDLRFYSLREFLGEVMLLHIENHSFRDHILLLLIIERAEILSQVFYSIAGELSSTEYE
jgi:hypothetical protein